MEDLYNIVKIYYDYALSIFQVYGKSLVFC
ncbi:hypothetical protein SAMN05216167_106332 [Spirosoma endophyticum]|uniref:Uncharacterized protein n=1 Tax=Spirosoma endophyticum TaxID=662367 RepID=A0A1I1UN96_9BACT|nr:hypothetical protein SAMN05216167_106332 [Spirosoma endophyticum]